MTRQLSEQSRRLLGLDVGADILGRPQALELHGDGQMIFLGGRGSLSKKDSVDLFF